MRYILVDRITHLRAGRSIGAIKNVSIGDDLMTCYAAGVSLLPASMVLEAMAQAVGLLVVATAGDASHPVLAKVQPFTTYATVRAGDRLSLAGEIEALNADGCRARATASVDGRLIAVATIHLALIPLPGNDRDAILRRAALADMFPGWFPAAAVTAPVLDPSERAECCP
jgi:3-hydroxyacyl-[acyl-carrier-protein] dehydratase